MWARILLVLAGYYVAGRLGLLLAIPPGYATAVWPAAGIAFAGMLLCGYRVWPGVVLGSFLVNVGVSFNADTLFRSLALPLGIGLGAALQAFLGALLVRRIIGFPNPLNREKDILLLFLLAGPICCLVSPTIGVTLRWEAGQLQRAEFPFAWWTWWIGDTIGVFVMAPVLLLWRDTLEPHWRMRPLTIAAPMALLTTLVVGVFVFADVWEQQRIRLTFDLQTQTLTHAVETQLESAVETLNRMRQPYGDVPRASDQQIFTTQARAVMKRHHPVVQALSWNPRVKDDSRPLFERDGRSERDPSFAIRERNPSNPKGGLIPAAKRDEYYPILYREPLPDDPKGLGYDVASDPLRVETLASAASTGEAIATPLIESVRRKEQRIFVYLPVYRDNRHLPEAALRQQEFVGYVVAVVRVPDLVNLAWKTINHEGIEFWLEDTAESTSRYHREATGVNSSPEDKEVKIANVIERPTEIRVANRSWKLRFGMTAQYLAAHRSLYPWTILAGGMLVTGLLGAVLLVVTGRAALIAVLVEERTAELAHANAALVQEINERRRAEEQLRRSQEHSQQLLESAPDAMVIVNEQGRIELVNSEAEKAFGYARAELIGQLVVTLIPERFHDLRNGTESVPYGAMFANPQFRPMGSGLELFGRRKDGKEFPIEISLSPLKTPEGLLVTAAIRDITERRRVQAALEENRRFIERVAAMMPSILYVFDLNEERYIFINQRFETILGYGPGKVVERGMAFFREHFHPDDWPKLEWVNEQLLTAEDGAVIETEYRVRHVNGEWRWLHSRETVFVRDENNKPSQLLGTAQDITERKRLEQEVLEIAALEQRRIGQELHDGTGQEMTGLCLLSDSLADGLRERALPEAQQASRIARGLRESLGRVRSLSRGLIPVEVDAEGLMVALGDLAQRISDLYGTPCVFECQRPVPMDDNFTATQFFRIAQEATTNAIKHGHATQIRISLETSLRYITLTISDDGTGFIAPPATNTGMGLHIMRYRASQIGAQLSVRSQQAGGTIVVCSLFRGGR